MAAKFELYQDSKGFFRWHLMSENGGCHRQFSEGPALQVEG